MNLNPDVLVVVPTRGERRDYLDLSVRSLAAQTLPPRVLVITQDGQEQLAEQWSELSAVSVMTQTTKGLSAAINEAWAADGWTSTFTGWLGDDDALPPWSVEEAVSVLTASPAASAVHGECLVIDGAGRPQRVYRNGRAGSWLIGYGRNLLPQPGSLFRTRAVQEVHGLDESLRLAMDVDLFRRLTTRGPVVHAQRQLGVFREHEDGLSTAQAAKALAEVTTARPTGRLRGALDVVATPLTQVINQVHARRGPAVESYWRP